MSNDLRTAAQQALYALKAMQSYASDMKAGLRICDESIDQLYAALSLKQAEPVALTVAQQLRQLTDKFADEWNVSDIETLSMAAYILERAEPVVDQLERQGFVMPPGGDAGSPII